MGFVYVLSGQQGCPKRFWRVDTSVTATWTFPKRLYFMIVADTLRTRVLSPSGRKSVSSCGVLLRLAGMNMDG